MMDSMASPTPTNCETISDQVIVEGMNANKCRHLLHALLHLWILVYVLFDFFF